MEAGLPRIAIACYQLQAQGYQQQSKLIAGIAGPRRALHFDRRKGGRKNRTRRTRGQNNAKAQAQGMI